MKQQSEIWKNDPWKRRDIGRRRAVTHVIDAWIDAPNVLVETGHVSLGVLYGYLSALTVAVLLALRMS